MSIIQRATNILLNPGEGWHAISSERATTTELYLSYILPLAAIGPIASFIGMSLIGTSVPLLGQIRTPIVPGITTAVLSYVLGLVGVFVFAMIVDALAPAFGGRKDIGRAFKIATYSFTPVWLASVLMVVPMLGMLVLLAGIYGIYMLYRGLPVMMYVDKDKALPYTLVAIVAAIVIQVMIGMVAGGVAGLLGMGQSAALSVGTSQGAVPAIEPGDGLTDEQRQQLEELKALSESLSKQYQQKDE